MTERRRIRVLIVDDSRPMRTVLRALLELDGRVAVLAEAADGAEAVRLVEEHAPDCVLLDLNMPVLGGLAAMPEIKGRAPRCKIVVFSGLEGGETVDQVIAAGADACLDKLTGLDQLMPTIVRTCEEERRVAKGGAELVPFSTARRLPHAGLATRPMLPAA
jgi:DNA-binding NarL/FixJ family response regulator